MNKTLYLFPVNISAPSGEQPTALSHYVTLLDTVQTIFAENFRSARRNMRAAGYSGDLNHQQWVLMEPQMDPSELISALQGITPHAPGAILSEAGMPGIADPGAEVVAIAHQLGIKVVPLVGPSSMFLALAASGFNGQQFTFHGYLPVNENERHKALKKLEHESLQSGYTQIFMETPYRNLQMIQSICKVLHDNTMVCIAADITGEQEFIATLPVTKWRGQKPNIHKRPAVYLISG